MNSSRLRELYWKAQKAGSDAAGRIVDRLQPFYCPLQQRLNRGVYAVEIRARFGFFAQLNQCLRVLDHCERQRLRPIIVLSSPLYVRAEGDNWLDYFFDSRTPAGTAAQRPADGSITFSRVADIDRLGLASHRYPPLTLESANRLLWTYLPVKNEFIQYVEAFVDREFGNRKVLGIHYRGTDKTLEANPVAWEDVAETVSNYLAANRQTELLFVASDEAAFVEWFRLRLPAIDVVAHDDTLRSRDGQPVHTRPTSNDNHMKGKEALVNSLLLSRCDALIRTASFLSGWSSIFNPDLPVILLNRPFDDKLWFPDAVVARKSLDAYLPGRRRATTHDVAQATQR